MTEPQIVRVWSSRIRSCDEQDYSDYIRRTGLEDYRQTPGNLGAQMLMRPLGDGTTEVTTLSWWSSMEAIIAFAGPRPEVARYYPEDDRFLLERPVHVAHHRIVQHAVPAASSSEGARA
jgi:heme-degrading monooxygenase HmoA